MIKFNFKSDESIDMKLYWLLKAAGERMGKIPGAKQEMMYSLKNLL